MISMLRQQVFFAEAGAEGMEGKGGGIGRERGREKKWEASDGQGKKRKEGERGGR